VVNKGGGVDDAVRDFRALFEAGAVGGLSDGQLLDRFLDRREGPAFEALVRRHGPMVWGVCRRVLRDHHDAEDAFQATFLVLARRAASVSPREQVGPWLHGVASQTALKARADRAKRRARELRAPDVPEPGAIGADPGDDLRLRLDRELGRLPEKYRIPIVLCELEGKTHREAADRLGWPIGTVSGRLSRGRALLARRLSRPGSAAPGGSLAALLAVEAASARPPAAPAASTVEAARAIAAGRAVPAGVVSAEVVALTRKVLRTMLLSRIGFMTAVISAGLALAAGATGLAYREQAAGGPRREAAPAPIAPAPGQAVDPLASYPFKVDPNDVREFPELTVDRGDFHFQAGPVSVVPISSERGITGVMVIGKGTFRYTPEKDKVIEGRAHAAMLRFNPEEQAAIFPLARGKKVSDRGAAEMSRHLLQVVIRHCYQSSKDGGRRQEVLIPPKGAFAAVLYSQDHGDLLISGDGRTATAFSFTDRKILYEKK